MGVKNITYIFSYLNIFNLDHILYLKFNILFDKQNRHLLLETKAMDNE